MAEKRVNNPQMVPFPSHSIIPERDLGKRPILEARHLGIDFGGLTAVADFDIIVGRTEIAGLSDLTAPEKQQFSTCLPRFISLPAEQFFLTDTILTVCPPTR